MGCRAMQSTPRYDVNHIPLQTLLTNAFFVDIWYHRQSELLSSFTDKRDTGLSRVIQNEIAFSLGQQESCVKSALSAELMNIKMYSSDFFIGILFTFDFT